MASTARGPNMPEYFLWTKIINPITTAAEYRKMLDLMLKARVHFELPVSSIPAVLLDALYAWNSQRLTMEHHPSLGRGKYATGWEANPVANGVLVVSKHIGGRQVWKSQAYPAAVVKEVFSQVDHPDAVFDTEEMSMLLWLFDRASQTA